MNWSKLKSRVQELVDECDGRMSVRIEVENEVIDFSSKQRYPSASLIKIPILFECFRQMELEKLQPDKVVTVPSSMKVGGSGVLYTLSENLQLSIGDLMTLMITVSDNTATNMLIDILSLEAIQSCIHDLGLAETELNRKLMDYDSMKKGINNFTCAFDMVTCLKTIHNHTILTQDSSKRMLSILENQQFTQKLPAYVDYDKVRVFNKTGEQSGVEHDCAILDYKGEKAYIAVLTEQLKDAEKGRQAIREIGKSAYDFLVTSV